MLKETLGKKNVKELVGTRHPFKDDLMCRHRGIGSGDSQVYDHGLEL
jgi:hypothetical protein